MLPGGQGLAEITHASLFSDGICGAEFNFFGPRVTQLPFYFAMKLKDVCPSFRFASVARPDLEARLSSLSDLKLLDLKVKGSFQSILNEADQDLGAALAANIRAVNGRPEDEFELKFVRRKNKKLESRSVSRGFLDGLRRLARRPELKEQVSIFKIQRSDGPVNTRLVDVLHEQFIATKEIQPAANEAGGVNPDSMFAAIEEAYAEVQAELAVASELSYEPLPFVVA